MPNKVITGLTGSILLPTEANVQRLNSVSINGGQALADISAYGGNGWVERVGLIKDLNGSAAGFLTDGNGATGGKPPLDTVTPEGGAMTITFNTLYTIAFTAIIGNIRIVGSYEGLNLITFDWSKGIGVPVVTWGAP